MSSFDSTHAEYIIARPFAGDTDFWRVRQFLLDTYPITPTGFNWEIRRWDGGRFHAEDPTITPDWSKRIHLWETATRQLVGVVHPEYEGEICFELHPAYRYLEADMLTWAEAHLAAPVPDSAQHSLELFVYEYDVFRQRLLAKRGYTKTPDGGVLRRLRLGRPLPLPDAMPDGYHLRETAARETDYQGMAVLLNAAFNRTLHTAAEYRCFTLHSPSFDHHLNLVAETTNGTFAAHAGITYDHTNHYAVIEPVCTHPDHRRKNLARILIQEGMCRAQQLGALDVYVGTGDAVAANALYDAVGFTEAYNGYLWRRIF